MERLWIVALDTVRLRLHLQRAATPSVLRAIESAAMAAGITILDACVVPCGVRAIVEARDAAAIRLCVRRFVAFAADSVRCASVQWRNGARLASITRRDLPVWRALLSRCKRAFEEDTMVDVRSRDGERGKRGSTRANVRAGVRCVHAIDGVVDAILSADESIARIHRYVADHDSPPDERVAFGRLCEVIFTQGIGIAVVIGKRDALRAAFNDFDPAAIAAFDDGDVRRLLGLPIIRNEAKIRACIENAKRWHSAAATEGTYLARVARIAAGDDAAAGWPSLVAALVADFVRIGEPAARQTLKRWGFFTAAPHPGSRRVVERLELIGHDAPPATAQLVVGAIAQALGRDPYSVEATLLFAALGPCRPMPQCARCALAERCPTGSRAAPQTTSG